MKTEHKIPSDNPSRISVDGVRAFIERRRSDGVSASTVRRDLQYLDGYLAFSTTRWRSSVRAPSRKSRSWRS